VSFGTKTTLLCFCFFFLFFSFTVYLLHFFDRPTWDNYDKSTLMKGCRFRRPLQLDFHWAGHKVFSLPLIRMSLYLFNLCFVKLFYILWIDILYKNKFLSHYWKQHGNTEKYSLTLNALQNKKYSGTLVRKSYCVCVLPSSFRGMRAFYFKIENKRDILNTTLLTRISVHKQSLAMGIWT